MTTAALCPYHHGRAALSWKAGEAVTDRAFDVGRIVCVAHGWESCAACLADQDKATGSDRKRLRFRRVVEPEDVSALAALLATVVQENAVTRIIIEAPAADGEEARRARWIVSGLRSTLPPSVTVDVVELPEGASRRDATDRARALLGATAPVLAPATVDASRDLAAASGVPLVAPPPEAPAAPAGEPFREVRTDVYEIPTHPPVVEVASPAHRPLAGLRVAGIDPGARYVAVTVSELDGAALRYVTSEVFQIGRSVPLRTPRKIARGDGTEREITSRRVVDDADVDVLLSRVVAFLFAHGVERVAVERASMFRSGKDTAANVAGARSALLLRSQWIGGELAGALRAASVMVDGGPRPVVRSVETCSSATWRAEMRRGIRGPWPDAVRARYFSTLPATPGEHVLDAAGLAAYAARPQKVERRAGPASPGGKRQRSSASRHGAEQAATAKRRAEAGCKCHGPKHTDPDCPIRAAANAKRAAKMKGNKNRAKR